MQELSILICRKLRKAGWKHAWVSKDLLLRLRSKKEIYSAESVLPLIRKKGDLVVTDMERDEILNEFFTSIFTSSQASHMLQVPGPLGGWEGSEVHFY